MSVSVYKTFSAGEVLTAADLNASLTQFTNNGTDVAFPLTKNVSAGDFTIASLGNATTDTGAANLRNIAILNKSVCDFRLSLTTAVPVTTSDVTAAETVYWVPYTGNCVGLYDGTRWHIRTTAELSIDVPDATNCYDVFVYDDGGTPTLELTAWTNDTTRATALTYQDGILVKTGATTRRYLGTFYCTTTGNGQVEDSAANRYLWNYYNQRERPVRVNGNAGAWNYTTATQRQANNSTANQFNFVIGVSENVLHVRLDTMSQNTNADVETRIAIGLDDAANASSSAHIAVGHVPTAGGLVPLSATYSGFPGVGKHFLAWLEYSEAVGTTTWYGSSFVCGFSGTILS